MNSFVSYVSIWTGFWVKVGFHEERIPFHEVLMGEVQRGTTGSGEMEVPFLLGWRSRRLR